LQLKGYRSKSGGLLNCPGREAVSPRSPAIPSETPSQYSTYAKTPWAALLGTQRQSTGFSGLQVL
jgi:hypothetical protein